MEKFVLWCSLFKNVLFELKVLKRILKTKYKTLTNNTIKKWKKEEIMQAYISAPKKGLNAELHNKKAKHWAEVLLEISLDGLKKRHKLNKSKQDETIYLSHVRDIINSGKNRAERLIEKYNKTKNLKFLFNEKEDFSYSGF